MIMHAGLSRRSRVSAAPALPDVSAAGASLAPAAIGMRLGGIGAAWFLHLWFLLISVVRHCG
jgi:hypothetical protein